MQLISTWEKVSLLSLSAMLVLNGFIQDANANDFSSLEAGQETTSLLPSSAVSSSSISDAKEASTAKGAAIAPTQESESFSVSSTPLFTAETHSIADAKDDYEASVTESSVLEYISTDSLLALDGRSPSPEDSVSSQDSTSVQPAANVETVDTLQQFENTQSPDSVSGLDAPPDTESVDADASGAALLTAQSDDMEVSTSNDWHFRVEPYIYAPFNVNGDVTARGVTADINLGLDDVLDSLNWAIFGRVESFSPDYRFGLIFDGAYISTSSNESTAFPVGEILDGRVRAEVADRLPQLIETRLPTIANRIFPNGIPDTVNPNNIPLDTLRAAAQERVIELRDRLSERVPDEFTVDAEADLDVGKFDFAVAYRLYDESEVNPDGVETEFDLGPIVFDIIAGVRIYTFDISIDLDTNIPGIGDRDLDSDTTVVEPLVGTALRFNLSPTFAVGSRFDISGFGWDDMTLSWALTAGIDWMFSGNTSLAVGYRVSQLFYDQGEGDDTTSIDLTQHGPYLGVNFRF